MTYKKAFSLCVVSSQVSCYGCGGEELWIDTFFFLFMGDTFAEFLLNCSSAAVMSQNSLAQLQRVRVQCPGDP